MLEKPESNEPSPIIVLLGEIYRISDIEIKTFQDTLLPHNSETFSKHPTTTQKILVAISRLNDSQLQNIYELAERSDYVAGIHDLRKFVNLYKELTTNTDPNIY